MERTGRLVEDYILIVDDDRDICNMLGIYLENEGFSFIKCDNGETALKLLQEYRIALVLLDVMMPEMDGIETCMKIRESTKVPIIFMSARVEDIDVVQGLMAGGDDYITKPFHPVQLIARVKAQLRRYWQYGGGSLQNKMLQHEDLLLDLRQRQVWLKGKEVHLTGKEYEILEYLMWNRGQVLSMAQIYEYVWREPFYQGENTVMMHMSNLRNKIRDAGGEADKYIQTIWGRGYKL